MSIRLWRARSTDNRARSPRLLRDEQLESRTLLAAAGPLANPYFLPLSADDNFGVYAPSAVGGGLPAIKAGPAGIPGAPTVVKAASANVNAAGYVTGKTAALSVLGSDVRGESSLVYDWTITSTPAGGAASFTVNNSNAAKNATVTFTAAGIYGIAVTIIDSAGLSVASKLQVAVQQTLSSIVVTPGAVNIPASATQQFSAQGLDQFQQVMGAQTTFTWSTNGGRINSAGLFTAPGTTGRYLVAAKSGAIVAGAAVTVTAPSPPPVPIPGGLQDPALASLVQQLAADGSLNREDMIQILTSVGASGRVSATDLSDLKTILANAARYNMPNYVQVLAADVVDGNLANADYQGAPLGNLVAGSSAAQLDDLIDKWFFGTDLPALTNNSLTYATASGSLFPTTPSHNDEYQGQLGDCYLISALGAIADSNPTAIENMFINNGDGTYTVRFYTGTYGANVNADGSISDGFTNNAGTADYVTVNLSLPTGFGGTLAYADYGFNASSPTNSLWIPLAEKAYAQWNETGNEGGDGENSYASISGGWMATVDAQVLGHNATDYAVTASTEQAMVNALAANEAVTIATDAGAPPDGLYGSHAYAVIGYNASSNLFSLYNPWGFDQPGTLSWSQLEATCQGFVTAVAAGSLPISGGNVSSSVAAATRISAPLSGSSLSPSTLTNVSGGSAAWTTVPAAETGPAAEPVVTGDTCENHGAAIFSARSTPPDSAAEISSSPTAAAVDAVLAFQGVRLSSLF